MGLPPPPPPLHDISFDVFDKPEEFKFAQFRGDLLETLLTAPLQGARVQVLDQKAVAKSQKQAMGGSTNTAKKGGGKGTVSRGIVETLTKAALGLDRFAVVGADANKRDLMVFDDIVKTVFGPLQGVPFQKINMAELRQCIRAFLAFVIHGTTTIFGEEVSRMSDCKSIIVKRIISAHITVLVAQPGQDDLETTESDIAQPVLTIGGKTSENLLSTAAGMLKDMFKDPSWVFEFVGFLNGNVECTTPLVKLSQRDPN